ncbi:ABC transporter permease [Pseudoroseicyclus aestuarii]|uniref:Amino acid ABC transporter membrane protein 2 (PAAT family) n=1 Tax=Pseudoroseicyclus aestuarii TaxID=1795041 RepID=A0A318SWT3_9RHOB|nr:ABC transporter permease [Pseudoroseicyclus aestuarii]PYE84859.1 amino acid ABC transporter membrane protein 2 (PAAT family) [Pseudoroseicyclus aestuarii]
MPDIDIPARPTPASPARILARGVRGLMMPHRIAMALVALAGLVAMVLMMDWSWLPAYLPRLWAGLGMTLAMLGASVVFGFLIALPLGVAQVIGPRPLRWLALGFCTVIRGTPLLLQLWLIYFGLGSLFAQFPELRETWLWPYLRQAWPYGLFALTISFAAYQGEVMRGAFAGVPYGELEAARAFGMSRGKVFRRVWFPRALYRALPTLSGEIILQLKSTPLLATITVTDLYAVITRVRQATFLTYEPLLFLVAVYLCLSAVLIGVLRWMETRVPQHG